MRSRARFPNKRQTEEKPKATGGVITLLQMQQRNKERVNVFLDEEYAFAVSLDTATTLKKGQRLSTAEVEALQQDGATDLAYQRAMRYLGMRPRSSAEIATYLKRKEYDEAVVESVVGRLLEKGYLDDETFARFWVENRNRFRPRGTQALRQELRQKGVERETIDTTLEEQDEDSIAWAAIESKFSRWTELEKFEFEQKAMAYLARRGFRFDVSRRAAKKAWEELQGLM